MYTVEQRLEIYKTMLRESLSPETYSKGAYKQRSNASGFCWMFSVLYNSNDLYNDFEGILPELYEKKKYDEGHWYMWNDWCEREESLAQCIQELQTAGGIV